MLNLLFGLLTSSLMMYFTYIDIKMVGNSIFLYGAVQLVYILLLKLFNKYLKDITGVFYGIALLIGGIMATICYTYHLLNHNIIPGLNYFFYVYIFIISILAAPLLMNDNEARNTKI